MDKNAKTGSDWLAWKLKDDGGDVGKLLSFTLVLMLAMRTTQCYSRWWEGRTLWGSIVNRSRDLGRQAATWICDVHLRECILRHTTAFVYATKDRLRGEESLADIKELPKEVRLLEAELADAKQVEHKPVHTLQVVGRCVSQAAGAGYINGFQLRALDQNITSLMDALGGCERILKTPFPLSYVSHIRTFAFLYLMWLPFTLVMIADWLTIPLVFIASLAVMGLEHLAAEVEQPFTREFNGLALDAICETISKNLTELAHSSQTSTHLQDATTSISASSFVTRPLSDNLDNTSINV